MIDGTSDQAFQSSVSMILRGMHTDERKRFLRCVATLISEGAKIHGSLERAPLQLHGLTADEVIDQAESINKAPVVEGELDGVRYTLYDQ